MRPTSDSRIAFLLLNRTEPVSRNWPGTLRVRTASFMAGNNGGASWHSSMTSGDERFDSRNASGLVMAKSRFDGLSRDTYLRAKSSASVVLPTCRRPKIAVIGENFKDRERSWRRCLFRRCGITLAYHIDVKIDIIVCIFTSLRSMMARIDRGFTSSDEEVFGAQIKRASVPYRQEARFRFRSTGPCVGGGSADSASVKRAVQIRRLRASRR